MYLQWTRNMHNILIGPFLWRSVLLNALHCAGLALWPSTLQLAIFSFQYFSINISLLPATQNRTMYLHWPGQFTCTSAKPEVPLITHIQGLGLQFKFLWWCSRLGADCLVVGGGELTCMAKDFHAVLKLSISHLVSNCQSQLDAPFCIDCTVHTWNYVVEKWGLIEHTYMQQ